MNPSNNSIKNKKFKQISFEERLLIEHMYNKQKKRYREIGEELGKNRSSIYREIKRGLVEVSNSDLSKRIDYSAVIGENRKAEKSSNKGPNLKIGKDRKLSSFIEEKIKKNYSPEVIAAEVRRENTFEIKLHWKTIYNYIDKGILLIDRKDLTYGNYRKVKKEKKYDSVSRRKLKAGRMISDRPKEIELREELGHWEMDLVEGSKDRDKKVLLVLTERVSRKEIIELLPTKEQASVIKALNRIEKREGVVKFRNKFKTITTDNGSEFLNYKGIEKSYSKSKKRRTNQYFANAYSSWQRGSNENQNKLIRRFLPKGTSFKELTSSDVKQIENWMNNYPRKMFNFKSPNEIYNEYLKKMA